MQKPSSRFSSFTGGIDQQQQGRRVVRIDVRPGREGQTLFEIQDAL